MKKKTDPSEVKTDSPLRLMLFVREHLTSRIIEILDIGKELNQSLLQVCDAIAVTSAFENEVFVRISYNKQTFQSQQFEETSVVVKHDFQLPDSNKGLIELFLSHQIITHFSGTAIEEAESTLKMIAPLLVGLISKIQLERFSVDIGERQKELKSINRTAEILRKSTAFDELLQEVCSFLPEAMQYPGQTVARIKYGDKNFTSPHFRKTSWKLQQTFDAPESTKGAIEIYYLNEFPEACEGPFLTEERNLIDNLAALISGTASKKALEELLIRNAERLKELKGINRTTEILQTVKSLDESLPIICSFLPESWQFPEYTVARIFYGKKVFLSPGFRETPWKMTQRFEASGRGKGVVEIFYLKQFPDADEGPFLKEERNLLVNLSNLIAGSATRNVLNKLQHENTERLKELKAINHTSLIIDQGK